LAAVGSVAPRVLSGPAEQLLGLAAATLAFPLRAAPNPTG
jgi:hypothetical protein